MIKSKVIPNVNSEIELYHPKTTSAEADICLKCPLPTCKSALYCRRYREEKRKMQKGQQDNGKKNIKGTAHIH